MIFKKRRAYNNAIATIERINLRNPSNPLFAKKAYQLAFCQYMAGNYQDAIGTIDLYNSMLADDIECKQKLLKLKVFSHNHLFEFEEARKTLGELKKHTDEDLSINQIQSLYDDAPNYKNPEKAKHLSILPGLGQVYCGDFFEGSMNFLLNASALGFGAWQVYSGYYFTGYVVGITLLQKFHSGGQHRAQILARQKNRENALKFNVKIVRQLKKEPSSKTKTGVDIQSEGE